MINCRQVRVSGGVVALAVGFVLWSVSAVGGGLRDYGAEVRPGSPTKGVPFWTGKVGDGNWLNCLIFDTQSLQALSEL